MSRPHELAFIMSDSIELTLTDIANGGQALGRHGNKTIFVPYAIPGETLTARIVEDRGRYAFAEGVRLLDASADRVMPTCPHFGPQRCGGCHWQHIDYPAQLALKTDILADQLSRIGGFEDVPLQMTLPSPALWHYRHEVILYPLPDGKLGFRSTDGKSPFLIDECHVIAPQLLILLDQLDLQLDTLSEAILRDNGAGDWMVILSTADDEPPELEMDIAASVNFLLSDCEPANLIGSTHLIYHILGKPYRVTAGSFWRCQPVQIEALAKLVVTWLDLQGHESILDLYGGVGLFSGVLAPQANLVTCVDSYPPAMTDAEENLQAFDNVDVIEADVADALVNLPEDHYDAVILDPPKEGLSLEVVDGLEAVLPPRMVYIGEDPATLARDLKRLHERYGYQLDSVQPVDFEPHTYRTVTAVHLHRE
jgi:23S rRNA (uracil1939-C5)-methyltransferase